MIKSGGETEKKDAKKLAYEIQVINTEYIH